MKLKTERCSVRILSDDDDIRSTESNAILAPVMMAHLRELMRGKRFLYSDAQDLGGIQRAVLYLPAPFERLVGEASIVKIISGKPLQVWRGTRAGSCIDKSEFDELFGSMPQRECRALKLADPVLYDPPLRVQNITTIEEGHAHRLAVRLDASIEPAKTDAPKLLIAEPRKRHRIFVDGFDSFDNLRSAAEHIGCSKSHLHAVISIGGHEINGHHIAYRSLDSSDGRDSRAA